MTQPFAVATFTVIPPWRVARHVISRPLVSARTWTPATAIRTRVGRKFNSMRTVVPREAVAVRVEAEIGAPQRAPQHHEEMASGTRFAPTLT
jgi:hypothetical protein